MRIKRFDNKIFIGLFGLLALVFTFSLISTRGSSRTINQEALFFKSQRVPLSFQYPKEWPISPAGQEWEDGRYLDNERLEAVDFSEEFVPNARNDSFGYVLVTKTDIGNLEEYLINKHSDKCILNLEVEKTNVGNSEGYRVHFENDPKCGSILGPKPDFIYYVYINGLLYQTALTNPSYKIDNPDETKRIFEEVVLTSMMFK